MMKPIFTSLSLLAALLLLTSCARMVADAKQQFADDLAATLLEQDDPVMVGQAIPAYLVLVSSMVRGDPDNVELLVSASKLYGAYASVFAEDRESRLKLAGTSLEYARRAFCLQKPDACNIQALSYYDFELKLAGFTPADTGVLFALGSAWAGWLQANSSDWNAVAELPKVKAVIQRVIDLDETVSNGDAHVYMGVMESFLPPAMGGKPEIARQHFERAIAVSNGSNQMARVLYAEKYARLVFDRELHDRLLREVLDAKPPPQRDTHTLINAIAQQKAKALLDGSPDYF